MGSPVLSDSSSRNTTGSKTRKPTASRTTSVIKPCQLKCGRNVPPDTDGNLASAPGPDDAIPLLGKLRPVLLEGRPVGRHQELHVLERHAAGRRWDIAARRMQEQ